eukprot:10788438-Alexandrium_andersonii.AAC.1
MARGLGDSIVRYAATSPGTPSSGTASAPFPLVLCLTHESQVSLAELGIYIRDSASTSTCPRSSGRSPPFAELCPRRRGHLLPARFPRVLGHLQSGL